jgi:hypothetical protein
MARANDVRAIEFRARVPLVWHAAMIWMAVFTATAAAIEAWSASASYRLVAEGSGVREGTSTRPEVWSFGLAAGFFAVAMAFFVYHAARQALEGRRAWAVIEGDELVVRDWLGTQTRIRFAAIVEVRLLTLGALCKPPRVYVRHDGRVTSISPWLSNRETLIREVVGRGSLRKVSANWAGERYRRV